MFGGGSSEIGGGSSTIGGVSSAIGGGSSLIGWMVGKHWWKWFVGDTPRKRLCLEQWEVD